MSLITTRFGRPAYEALTQAVARAKGADPLREVLLVVPTEPLKVSSRRWLAEHGVRGTPGIAGLAMLSLRRLAETVAAATVAGRGRRPITAPVLAGGMRVVVASTPGLFQQIADHPQTARALADASRELDRVQPSRLRDLAAGSAVSAAVIDLHLRVQERFRRDYYDETELLRVATETVAHLPPVVLFLPQELAPAEQRFLGAVAQVTPVTAIVGVTGSAADARVLSSVADALCDQIPDPVELPEPIAGTVICTTDADDEVRAAISVVVQHLQAGTAGHRIGIVYPTADPYARLLHEQLSGAGIKMYGRGVKPAAERIFGRAVRALLRLPERDFRRSEVAAWLNDARPAGINPVRADRLSRRAGIVSGPDWAVRLEALAAALLDQADHEDDQAVAARRREDAQSATHLREFVDLLRDDLQALDTARTWEAAASRFDRMWCRLFPEPAGDPEELRIHGDIRDFVHGLRGLDQVAGKPSLAILRETLELDLRHSTTRVGTIGTGVMVGPIADAVGQQFDMLCVLGMAEGTLPPVSADDPLLPEAVRVLSDGVLPTWRDRQDRQHRDLLAALAGAEAIVMTFPRGDLRSGTTRVPSRWLLPTLQHYLGSDVQATDWQEREHTAIVVRDSYAQGVLDEDPVSTTGLRQRLALVDPGVLDPVATRMLADRRANAFSRFTGFVGDVAPMPPIGRSATALQAYFACPHHYFNHYILGLRELDDPDETIEMSALDQGSLQHRVLEQLVAQWPDPDFGAPWPPPMVTRLDELIDAEFADAERAELTGLRTPWRRLKRRLRRDLHEWIGRDNALRADRWKPLAPELGFTDLDVALPNGTTLTLRGSVDRVDVDRSGNLRVLDYKTGSSSKYQGLSESEPTKAGAFLQLPIYAMAAERAFGRGPKPTQSCYWFISSAQKGRIIGYDVREDVKRAALEVIQVAVVGHQGGLFPARPVAHSGGYDCPSCQVDGGQERISSADFEQILEDPRLADYRKVVAL